MSVTASSVEATGEGTNGAAALTLDGDANTYWHSKWQGGFDAFPHMLTYKLGAAAVDLGRVHLSPRLSSNGSGRINEYVLETAVGADCAAASYTEVATGSFPGDLASREEVRTITLDTPVSANCVRVTYESAWGGSAGTNPISPEGSASSLAEFNADIATETTVDPTDPPVDPEPGDIPIPEGAVEIASDQLRVRLHPDFPQVVDYRLGGDQLAGRLGAPLTSILINEAEQPVTVADPVVAGNTATYALTFPNLAGVSFDAVFSVEADALTMTLTNIVDPDNAVNRVRIPGHNLVTVTGNDAQLTAGLIGVNRQTSGDRFEPLATTAAGGINGSWLLMANDDTLAATLESNATEDNRGPQTTSGRVATGNNRLQRQITEVDGVKHGAAYSGTWVWLAESVEEHADAEGNIGRENDPQVTVKLTRDRNDDAVVDWQDAALAHREIMPTAIGSENVKNQVVSRIPFNIVSQATHPFLRTLDDTKRISLATDNLGQRVLLKGYQSEGHDAAHPDYAGHYNERAGGFEDLKTLTEVGGDKYNSSFGVHVNATESYSEAKSFSEDLLYMPPRKAWGWMNQSYYIDGPKDLATGEVLKRFQDFYDEKPRNLDWLYVDVYYPYGWEMERFAGELAEQGWELSSEWSDRFPNQLTWSHWSQDEPYGGATNKGLNSNVMRFIYNDLKDAWNPHPVLGNTNVQDFEGWAGKVDYNKFIANIWQRNLPTTFLQQSNIVKWETGKITFANGTVATSPLESIAGTTVPTNRTIEFDGATVYDQGKYLLPWTDGGEDRLYHYNGAGGTSVWELGDAWKQQASLTLFELTDTGRVEVGEIAVTDGSVTIDAQKNTAYVLYPTSAVPEPVSPQWGEGSGINDPGFFSGTTADYDVQGDVTVEYNERRNYEANFGPGESSISQRLTLPAGTYSAWAWVEIEPGKTRPVTVEATGSGITAAGYTEAVDGGVANTIQASTVMNATASDQKLRFNHQRVRVTFTTDGSAFDFTVKAPAGDALVRVDDLRVVEFTPSVDPAATEETIFFEDYENTDTGYFPFVTGRTNAGGDARTQLARLHAPYSQKGWWGVDETNTVSEGAKYNDNVLHGNWSLMLNNENTGEVLKTSPGAIPFKAGQRYRVSFDYQTTYADQYRIRLGSDVVTDDGVRTVNAVSDVLGQQRETATWSQEFDASCGANAFIAVDKLAGANTQHNMTIDDIRVEHLGAAETNACLEGTMSVSGTPQAGREMTVTTTITSLSDEATDVTHKLDLPEGWTATVATAGPTELAFGETSTQVWTVTVPEGAQDSVFTFTGTVTVDGAESSITRTHNVIVVEPLPEGEIYLSDMRDRVVGQPSNGWGPIEWDLGNGEQGAGDGPPLKIDGETYLKGIGMHAPANVTFGLEGECQQFKATVGINDIQTGRGSVIFIVQGDGEELYRTPILRHNSEAYEIDIDITGVNQLRLIANDAGDGNGNDHADWALARVVCSSDEVPGDTVDPEITAIGAQTGTVGEEFSLQVEATDDVSEALTYSATGLPAGLSIDENTGLISGTPTAAGTSNVTVTVTDEAGNAATATFALTVSPAPTVDPTEEPTEEPTQEPTEEPTQEPTEEPTEEPTQEPTDDPTDDPTDTPTDKPTEPKKFERTAPYTKPGLHKDLNGRDWNTVCEPYSQTERCRTDIWATVVLLTDEGFQVKQGWAFNNLTYLPFMTKAAWGDNPLANTGEWTADTDSRQWRTVCGTAETGRDGCRSYAYVTVYKAVPRPAGGYEFSQYNEWVFNNIVMFGDPSWR
ncbi:endo-alpha-N-acetylgalactosaminidase family protein [Tessaracoccus massiliensis]|uniref:endo-alpha-N-acetylgalactosaminidase family protein n=1 Tax=Tessaracoccus massiliensis TaxID=1522311 RepID=UPI0006947EB9|nr:endo-alpha-N-acetylgalactosaminidase family protein [Tessaracoccus massiliensis]